MSRLRQTLRRVVPLAVSGVALGWLFATLDFHVLVASLTWSVVAILGPSLVAYGAVALWIEAVSMIRLVPEPPQAFGIWTAARIKSASYLIGIVNYALGGAALTVMLRRRAGLGLGESASVVVMLSAIDLVLLLALAAVGATMMETRAPAVRAGVVALVGGGFVGGLALLRAPVSLGPLERLRELPIFDALRHTPLRTLTSVVGLRLLFSAAFVAVCGSAFAAFGIAVPLATLVVGVMVVALVAALPIAVAGLGTSQIAFLYVFRGIAEKEVLLALSLVLSAGLILLRVAMGLAFAREYTREALRGARDEERGAKPGAGREREPLDAPS